MLLTVLLLPESHISTTVCQCIYCSVLDYTFCHCVCVCMLQFVCAGKLLSHVSSFLVIFCKVYYTYFHICCAYFLCTGQRSDRIISDVCAYVIILMSLLGTVLFRNTRGFLAALMTRQSVSGTGSLVAASGECFYLLCAAYHYQCVYGMISCQSSPVTFYFNITCAHMQFSGHISGE